MCLKANNFLAQFNREMTKTFGSSSDGLAPDISRPIRVILREASFVADSENLLLNGVTKIDQNEFFRIKNNPQFPHTHGFGCEVRESFPISTIVLQSQSNELS